MNSVYEEGTRGVTGAMRTPARPAIAALMIQLRAERRDVRDERPLLSLGRRPGMQPEAGKAIAADDNGGQQYHGDGEPHTILWHPNRADQPCTRWEDRPDGDGAGTGLLGNEAGKDDHHPKRCHGLAHSRRRPEGPERRPVEEEPEGGRYRHRDDERRPESHGPTDAEGVGQPRDRVQDLASTQVCIDIRADHGHGTRCEVDDTRAAIGDDESQSECGVDGSVR